MKRRGFTLIEIIMVILLAGIISSLFGLYIYGATDAWLFLSQQKSMSMESRSSLYKMVREIKRTDKNTAISTFASSALTFTDIDGNQISYTQSGSQLLRNSYKMLDDLNNPGGLTFTYLDKNGTSTASLESIKTISVRLSRIKDDNKFVVESAANIRKRELW